MRAVKQVRTGGRERDSGGSGREVEHSVNLGKVGGRLATILERLGGRTQM